MAGEEGRSPRELRLTHHRTFLLSCIGHDENGLHYTTSTGLKQSDTALHPEIWGRKSRTPGRRLEQVRQVREAGAASGGPNRCAESNYLVLHSASCVQGRGTLVMDRDGDAYWRSMLHDAYQQAAVPRFGSALRDLFELRRKKMCAGRSRFCKGARRLRKIKNPRMIWFGV